MSRNASGTYTLPSGNPVVSGTLIEASWANTTLSDIASALTDSLSRSGEGGMTAALRLFDGTSSVPGLAWGSETTTGWYRAGAGDMRLVITGSQVIQYLSTGVAVTGTLSSSGNFAVNTNKFTVAAASGNTAVAGTLDVTGNATFGGTLAITGALTLTANPTLSAGTANGVLYLNGSKVATSGSALWFDGSNLGVGNNLATTVDNNNGSGKLVVGTGSGSQGMTIYSGSSSGNEARITFANSSTGSGSYAAQISYKSGDAAVLIYNNNAERYRINSDGTAIWSVAGSEAMRLTSTGLGIGTSSPAYKLDVVGNAIQITSGAGQKVRLIDNTVQLLNSTATASGVLSFKRADGTQKAAIGSYYNVADEGDLEFIGPTGSTNMILSSSGNLGLGVTPSAFTGGKAFEVAYAGNAMWGTGAGDFSMIANVKYNGALQYANSGVGANRFVAAGGAYQWFTAPSGTAGDAITFSQVMTLNASGNLQIGTTTDAARLTVSHNSPGGTGIDVRTTGSDATPISIYSRITAAGSTANWHLAGQAGGVDKVYIYGNGNIVNSNNSYGTLSDVKLKENIVDATPKLADVLRLQVRNFNLKTEPEHKQIGFVAQEFEQVFPRLIDESPDRDDDGNETGEITKSIKTSVLVPILVKAIQELEAIIEQLTARVAQLEGK